jgi:hypothetical protein
MTTGEEQGHPLTSVTSSIRRDLHLRSSLEAPDRGVELAERAVQVREAIGEASD